MTAHAIYAPSSAHRWTKCTASAQGIAALGPLESGDEAEAGTAAHEELERCLEKNEPQDYEHPASYAVALALDYVRQLPPGQMWVEQRVRLTDEIWGRCDVAHWHAENRTLTILDLKNGYVDVDAVENEQLRIYAAGSIYTHNLPTLWIRYVVVQPNSFMPVPRVKQWVESADDLFVLAQRVAAIPDGPKTFVPGEHCKYCPLFGKCPATQDVLTKLGIAMAGSPESVAPGQVALFKAMEKPITDWFKALNKTQLKAALAGRVPDGMKVVTASTHKAWRSVDEARALVISKLGVNGLDPPTPAQAIERGCSEAEVNAMAPRPEGGPALAFASDKRPAWQAKSVATMFAGAMGK